MNTNLQSLRTVPILVFFLAAGCATYVNIPPHPGDLAAHDPNLETVQQVCRAALQAVLEDQPIEGPYQFVLPAGSSPVTYEKTAVALGHQARWKVEGTETDLPVLEVRQVRIRGWVAQADVIRPLNPQDPKGPQQMVTVDLQWDAGRGWYARRLYLWRLSVEQALQESLRREVPPASQIQIRETP